MFTKLLIKKALLGTAVFSFALGLAIAGMQEKGGQKTGGMPNIVQTAQQAGQFKTLLTAG